MSLSMFWFCGLRSETLFLSIFACHSLFYSSLPKNTSAVVKQYSTPRCLPKTWWPHDTVIIGNELTFRLKRAPRMDSFFFLYQALCWIRYNFGKSLCCGLWSFKQKHNNEPRSDSNPCQVTQPCTDLVFMISRTGETSYEVRSHIHLALCSCPAVAEGWDIQGEHMSLGIFCGPFSLASRTFLSWVLMGMSPSSLLVFSVLFLHVHLHSTVVCYAE